MKQPLILFLKATTKKQIWIPAFTKKDGTVVGGHYQTVNISTDHDHGKIASGQGTDSQKKAHKKLHAAYSDEPEFHALPDEHKAAHIMVEATKIQAGMSLNSDANTFKNKIIKGQKPTPKEIEAFYKIPQAKRDALLDEIAKAGKMAFFYDVIKLPESVISNPKKRVISNPKKPVSKDVEKPDNTPKYAPNDMDATDAMKQGMIPSTDAVMKFSKLPKDQLKAKFKEIHEKIGADNLQNLLNLAKEKHLQDEKGKQSKPTVKPIEDGPKEGDTKQGATGVLVFKNGHWIKQHKNDADFKKKPGDFLDKSDLGKIPAGSIVQLIDKDGKDAVKFLVGYSQVWKHKKKGGGYYKDPYGSQQAIGYNLDHGYQLKLAYAGDGNWIKPEQKQIAEYLLNYKLKKGVNAGAYFMTNGTIVVGTIGQPNTFFWINEKGDHGGGFNQFDVKKLKTGEELKPIDLSIMSSDIPSGVPSKDQALQAAIDHLTEDSKQPDIPAHEQAEDKALVETLKEAKAGDGPSVQTQLEAIAALPKKNYKKQAYDKLSKSPEWASLPDPEKLSAVMDKYKQLQTEATGKSNVVKWKQAMLSGKVPTPAQHLAYQNLEKTDLQQANKAMKDVVSKLGVDEAMKLFAQANAKLKQDIQDDLEAAKKNTPQKILAQMGDVSVTQTYDGYIVQSPDGVKLFKDQEQAIDYAQTLTGNGPKEGDTKTKNGVTYILQNGRWHRVTPIDATGQPKDAAEPVVQAGQSSNDADKPVVFKTDYLTSHENGANKYWWGSVQGNTSFTYHGKIGTKGKMIPKPFASPDDAINYLTAKAKQKLKEGYVVKTASGTSAPTPPPAQPNAPTPPSAAPSAPVEDITGKWHQVGGQKGSNPGGTFKDENGHDWYVKFPATEAHVDNEVLAAKLYEVAGVAVPEVKKVVDNGKVGVASKFISGLSTGPNTLRSLAKQGNKELSNGFVVDAWLANWDAVGMNYDNLLVDKNSKPWHIDTGGALLYRAQGGKKPDLTADVHELKTMLDPAKNPTASNIFSHLPPEAIKQSAQELTAIDPGAVIDAVNQYGGGSQADKKALADTLLSRLKNIKNTLGLNQSTKKTKIDITKLTVNEGDLQKPYDFKNWNGPGNGLSSKPWVNEANEKACQLIYEFAKQGNLPALKDYHFESIDKETGEPTGRKPIAQHPSHHVVQYWAALVDQLETVAYPSGHLTSFRDLVGDNLARLCEKIGSHKYGVSLQSVGKSERLAYWVAIAKIKDIHKFAPAEKHVTSDEKNKSASWYGKIKSLTKTFISGVQSSGSYNNAFRNGLPTTSDGHDALAMVQSVYADARTKPEGTTIYKWTAFSDKQIREILSAPDGLVIENPGSMCTSMHPTATSGFGAHRIKIRYANGAVAIDSFASGAFASEQEITTIPGQRFAILSKKMVPKDGGNGQRLELELLMLPPDAAYIADLKAKTALA